MIPPLPQSRAFRPATEDELKLTMQDKNGRIIEWPAIGLTFVRSDQTQVILRAGALGADTREIHGGNKYPNTIALAADWEEIRYAAVAFTPPNERDGIVFREGRE